MTANTAKQNLNFLATLTTDISQKLMTKKSALLIGGSFFALLISGCATVSNDSYPEKGQTVPATVIDSLPICNMNETSPYITLLNSTAELSAFYQTVLDGEDSEDLEDLPLVDFGNASVILAGIGQKPSAGYQVNYLFSNNILKNGNNIDMTITTVEPDEDDTVATVLTSPCVLVETPKLVNVKSIQLWDQNFDLLVTSKP